MPGRDLAPRLVQLGFHFVGQLKMILEVIINPLADFLDFLPRQFWNRRLNFFDRAHSQNLTQNFPDEKREERMKEEGRRKKEEGRRKKEEGETKGTRKR